MTMDDLITRFMNDNPTSTAPPPATNQALDSLPRFKADKAMVDGGNECTVCKDGFKLGDEAIRLPCLHVL
jgi:E3 ubiquitin-protein ligase RNF115/126